MISSFMGGLGEIVSLLWRFCALTNGAAVGFGGGLGGPKRTPLLCLWSSTAVGAKGLVGVVAGPPQGLEVGQVQTLMEIYQRMQVLIKFVSEEFVKIPKISKIREIGEAKHGALVQRFFFFLFNHVCFLFWGKYRRMQLFGYGVRKKPIPYTSAKNIKIPRKYKILVKNPVEPTSPVRKSQIAKI